MASDSASTPIRIAEVRQHAKQGRVAELKAVLTTLAEENRLSEHVGARDAEGNTAFHLACYHGHIECVRLLEENSSNTLEQTDAGLSGLMMAAERGYIKLCQHLLPTAELEATCNKGWTAFIHACAAGQADCVELLVRADCDTKAKDSHGLSGKDIAVARDHSAVLMRLRALVLEKLNAAGHTLATNKVAARAPTVAPVTTVDSSMKERPTSYLPAGDALLLSRKAATKETEIAAAATRTGHDDSEQLLCDAPTSTSDYTQNQFGTPEMQATDSILNFASSVGDFKRKGHKLVLFKPRVGLICFMCGGSGAPGTDEERAERLARMMSAQCTLEPPEVVGLRTGWRPASSGNGVTPDGSVPNTFGGAFGESISSGGFSGLFGNPADPLTPLGAAAVSFVAASGTAASRRTSVAAAASPGGGRPMLNPLSPLGALGRGRGGWAAGSMDGGATSSSAEHASRGSGAGTGQLLGTGSGRGGGAGARAGGAASKQTVFNFHIGSSTSKSRDGGNARFPIVRQKHTKSKEPVDEVVTADASTGGAAGRTDK